MLLGQHETTKAATPLKASSDGALLVEQVETFGYEGMKSLKVVEGGTVYQVTADGSVGPGGAGWLFGYIVISSSSGLISLRDAITDAGTRIIGGGGASGKSCTTGEIVLFDKAVRFENGLYADVSGTITINIIAEFENA